MRPRNLVIITLLALCHLQLSGQALTNALPAASPATRCHCRFANSKRGRVPLLHPSPGRPQPGDAAHRRSLSPCLSRGVPVQLDADRQTRVGDVLTLDGHVVVHYRDYILRADKVVYHQSTSSLEADGHLQVSGGPNDVLINASHGDMRLDMHTARFYNVSGSQGIHSAGRTAVYSTSTPFLFTARVLLQTGDDNYRLIDGTMTNCRFPRPDWQIISHAINLENGTASTSNSFFKFLGMPVFYLPYLRHPVDENGRESGLLIPVLSNSSIKGFIVGEQSTGSSTAAWTWSSAPSYSASAAGRPMATSATRAADSTTSSCAGMPCSIAASNSRLETPLPPLPFDPLSGPPLPFPDPSAMYASTRAEWMWSPKAARTSHPGPMRAGTMEYLSSYLYRLVFNDNFSQAISSQVASDVGLTHAHNGLIPSLSLDRFETFASSTNGDEARILHLPSLRYDVLDRPLGSSPLYWGLGSSIAYLSRSEPRFHARNVGRIDFYPHLSLPLVAGGWSVVPEVAIRDTSYTISQIPDLTDLRHGVPTISHDPLHRIDAEASIDIRPPAIERDFVLARWNRVMRHVIEPELTYRYVGGIGSQARNVLLIDTTDIATNTNEAGFSLTQRFYLSPKNESASAPSCSDPEPSANCPRPSPRVGQLADRSECLHRPRTSAARSSPAAATSSTPPST